MARPRSNGNKKSNPSPPQRGVDLVARTVCEVYDALAEGYAQNYESGDPDKPFLDEFLSPPERRATPRPWLRDRQQLQVLFRAWYAS